MRSRTVLIVVVLAFGLTGCYVFKAAFYPAYDDDNVYTMGYAGYCPHQGVNARHKTCSYGTRDGSVEPRPEYEGRVRRVQYVGKAYYVGSGDGVVHH